MSGDPERTRGRKYHLSFSNTFDIAADYDFRSTTCIKAPNCAAPLGAIRWSGTDSAT
jgi:hypothetical protein